MNRHTIKAYKWVLWVCSVCSEEFSACISERVQGKGYCPVCTGKKLRPGFNDVATVAPEIAHELADASLIVAKSGARVDWLCSVCSKEWRASPKARLNGRACPHCRAQTKVTRGQRELTEFLTAISPVESDVKIPGSLMEIDCYLPEFGVGFEFNGDYWHSDNVTVPRRGETSKDRELRKLRLAADAGIRLFIVWESDWLTVRAEVETAIESALAGGEPKLLLKVAGVPFDRPRSAVSTRKGSLIEGDFGPEHYEEFRELYFAGESPGVYAKAKGFTKSRVYSYVQAHTLDEERFRKYGVTKNGGRTAKAVREYVERMEKADSES